MERIQPRSIFYDNFNNRIIISSCSQLKRSNTYKPLVLSLKRFLRPKRVKNYDIHDDGKMMNFWVLVFSERFEMIGAMKFEKKDKNSYFVNMIQFDSENISQMDFFQNVLSFVKMKKKISSVKFHISKVYSETLYSLMAERLPRKLNKMYFYNMNLSNNRFLRKSISNKKHFKNVSIAWGGSVNFKSLPRGLMKVLWERNFGENYSGCCEKCHVKFPCLSNWGLSNNNKIHCEKCTSKNKCSINWNSMRKKTWLNQSGELYHSKCYCCDRNLTIFDSSWHVGHNSPKSRGGSNEVSNLFVICNNCNFDMSNSLTIDEYKRARKDFLLNI